MSLEEALTANTAALKEHTLALKAGGTRPAATAPVAGRPPGRPPKTTLEQVKAVAEKVKADKGVETAVSLIKAHGAEKLAGLDPSKFSAFVAACEVALAEEDDGEATEDDGL
jgi:hypothetical protein